MRELAQQGLEAEVVMSSRMLLSTEVVMSTLRLSSRFAAPFVHARVAVLASGVAPPNPRLRHARLRTAGQQPDQTAPDAGGPGGDSTA
jgi:hypothetical protein